jgi:FtsH-binding integral membrane protein
VKTRNAGIWRNITEYAGISLYMPEYHGISKYFPMHGSHATVYKHARQTITLYWKSYMLFISLLRVFAKNFESIQLIPPQLQRLEK